VDLDAVEQEILALAARFPLDSLRADPWQGVHLAQRLQRQRVPVMLAPVDAPRVDRLTTLIKTLFVRRLIRFGAHLLPLREQLEGMTVHESKARGLLRFEGGGTKGAAMYSDLVFALALACEACEAQGILGRMALPMAFDECYRSQSPPPFDILRCFFFGGAYVPPGDSDPACKACPGWIFLRKAYAEHVAAGGERMDIRAFRQRLGDNDFTGRVKQSQWESWYL
jgi:hypothetical protein